MEGQEQMSTLVRASCSLLTVLVAAMVVTACGGVPEPDYASDIAEGILNAINSDDYDKYSEFFTQEMKDKVPEPTARQLNSVIKLEIGTYESKEFWRTEITGQYTAVYYQARFTNEPDDVIVKVVFQKAGGKVYVAGLWLDSPKLRGG